MTPKGKKKKQATHYMGNRINSDTSIHTAEEKPDHIHCLWLNDKNVTDVPLLWTKILRFAKQIISTLLLLITPQNHGFK